MLTIAGGILLALLIIGILPALFDFAGDLLKRLAPIFLAALACWFISLHWRGLLIGLAWTVGTVLAFALLAFGLAHLKVRRDRRAAPNA